MGLKEYNRKRDFKKTAEPPGKVGDKKSGAKRKALSFIVQKHDASHLHYDFRLEIDGVLKSWAVPKGPSLDPSQKRLAMHVEDHPVAYGGFEGTIPKGEYGGGTVMLWDTGTWLSDEDPAQTYAKGSMKFELKGEKLKGRWKLFRMRTAGENTWLIMKQDDDFAQTLREGDILTEQPLSVKTGRDLDAIAADDETYKSGKVYKPSVTKPSVTKKQPAKVQAPVKKSVSETIAKEIKSKSQIITVEPASKSAAKKKSATVSGINISHPDKIYYPDEKVTKLELAQYYERVAPLMVPLIKNRPLMIVRCPEGAGKQGFFQKHWTHNLQGPVKTIPDPEGDEPFFVIDSTEGLVSLAQAGSLEIHTWGTHAKNMEFVDQWVFDLDPAEAVPWSDVVDTAFLFKKHLEKYELKSWVKTTGGKGLHVVVPLTPKLDWDLGKNFTKALCEDIVASRPDKYLLNMSKAKRKGKIFLDYLRNGRGATAVAPYSPRARPGATLSIPITWDELKKGVKADAFNIHNIDERIGGRFKDPWKDILTTKQLPKVSRPKKA